MPKDNLYEKILSLMERLEDSREAMGSTDSEIALRELEEMAKTGCVEAISHLSAYLSEPGPFRNAEAAYKWAVLSYSADGYLTDFVPQSGPLYCGPVGDFRNEIPIIELVNEIKLERVRELDQQARLYRESMFLYFCDPRDSRSREN
jgi:hypothetical protein